MNTCACWCTHKYKIPHINLLHRIRSLCRMKTSERPPSLSVLYWFFHSERRQDRRLIWLALTVLCVRLNADEGSSGVLMVKGTGVCLHVIQMSLHWDCCLGNSLTDPGLYGWLLTTRLLGAPAQDSDHLQVRIWGREGGENDRQICFELSSKSAPAVLADSEREDVRWSLLTTFTGFYRTCLRLTAKVSFFSVVERLLNKMKSSWSSWRTLGRNQTPDKWKKSPRWDFQHQIQQILLSVCVRNSN